MDPQTDLLYQKKKKGKKKMFFCFSPATSSGTDVIPVLVTLSKSGECVSLHFHSPGHYQTGSTTKPGVM